MNARPDLPLLPTLCAVPLLTPKTLFFSPRKERQSGYEVSLCGKRRSGIILGIAVPVLRRLSNLHPAGIRVFQVGSIPPEQCRALEMDLARFADSRTKLSPVQVGTWLSDFGIPFLCFCSPLAQNSELKETHRCLLPPRFNSSFEATFSLVRKV